MWSLSSEGRTIHTHQPAQSAQFHQNLNTVNTDIFILVSLWGILWWTWERWVYTLNWVIQSVCTKGCNKVGTKQPPAPPTSSLLCFFFILFYLFKQPHYNFPKTRITILPFTPSLRNDWSRIWHEALSNKRNIRISTTPKKNKMILATF